MQKESEKTEIPEDIFQALITASDIIGGDSTWMKVKRIVLNLLSPSRRKLFSTRDRKTYRQHPNALELTIIEKYTHITGHVLLDEDIAAEEDT